MDLQAVQQNWELNDNGYILLKLKLKQQISKKSTLVFSRTKNFSERYFK